MREEHGDRTYHNDKDSLEGCADENKDAGTEDKGRGDFLDQAQTGLPEQGEGDQDEIDIGREVRSKRGPDDGPRHGGLAEVARVRVDLPVLMEWQAGEEDGGNGGDISREDQSKSSVDANAVAAAKSVLPTSQPQVSPRKRGSIMEVGTVSRR
jgi:hypothetical protein